MPHIIYVVLPCTDLDWDRTATERTCIYLAATLRQEWIFVPYAFRRYQSGDVTKNSTCLHTNALKFYSLLLNFVNFTIQYGNTKKSQQRRKLRRIYVCTPSLDKVLLVNSSTLISEHNSSLMIRIVTGDWSSCEQSTIVISMWKIHRWAELIENRKEDWPWECPFTKGGESRSISTKPTGIRKEKDIPGLPGN